MREREREQSLGGRVDSDTIRQRPPPSQVLCRIANSRTAALEASATHGLSIYIYNYILHISSAVEPQSSTSNMLCFLFLLMMISTGLAQQQQQKQRKLQPNRCEFKFVR